MSAIVAHSGVWPGERLAAATARVAALLRAQGTRVLATLLDNGPAWITADAAAQAAGCVHVPLPAFFSQQQLRHALGAAGVDTLWLDARLAPALQPLGLPPSSTLPAALQLDAELAQLRLPARNAALPAGTCKISFTSGTSGEPKGVCLSGAALDTVAKGIGAATASLGIERHLSALPYAVLLENIAGVLAPRARDATCVALPLAEVGLRGSSRFDPAALQAAVERHGAHSLVLLPQMLAAWSLWLGARGQRAPASLRLVAVGGAIVGAPLLATARAVGIPAYEGYGLSEGASVQTLNLPGADRAGSAGRALPHARLRVAPDGEIEIGGALFLGYLGDAAAPPAWWPSGDLGHIDADGFLHVRGRKKQVLITAFGRNVSPEWVEAELAGARPQGRPVLAQAVVFGDAQPALSAVLWPLQEGASDAALQAAVDAANAALPDYARVARWTRGAAPLDSASGFATPNGRPRRAAILDCHAAALGIATPQPA